MQRAYSLISFKAVDSEARIIEGLASTPAPDRIGDVMEPKGAKFTLPLPLLWQHQADKPIGTVISATATAAGIKIRAQIAKGIPFIDETAWPSVKAGLVPGLSIGFRAIDAKRIPGGDGGLHITKWDWFELSTVTVPMNAGATIQSIKSADAPHLALSGGRSRAASTSPAVVGSLSKDRSTKMNYSEQRSAAQAELTQKKVALDALMALDELDEEQNIEADSLTSEIERLNSKVKRYAALEGTSQNEADTVERRAAAPIPARSRRTDHGRRAEARAWHRVRAHVPLHPGGAALDHEGHPAEPGEGREDLVSEFRPDAARGQDGGRAGGDDGQRMGRHAGLQRDDRRLRELPPAEDARRAVRRQRYSRR
jgi:HK97 family phage prohead protease